MKFVHTALFAYLVWSTLAFLPCQGTRMWLAGNTFVLMESSPWASLEKAGSLGRDGLQDNLALLSKGPGISSGSAYNRLCDLGQVTLPEHILASQSLKKGGGVGLRFQDAIRAAFLKSPKESCSP